MFAPRGNNAFLSLYRVIITLTGRWKSSKASRA